MDPNGGPIWGPMFIMYPFHVLNSRAWSRSPSLGAPWSWLDQGPGARLAGSGLTDPGRAPDPGALGPGGHSLPRYQVDQVVLVPDLDLDLDLDLAGLLVLVGAGRTGQAREQPSRPWALVVTWFPILGQAGT